MFIFLYHNACNIQLKTQMLVPITAIEPTPILIESLPLLDFCNFCLFCTGSLRIVPQVQLHTLGILQQLNGAFQNNCISKGDYCTVYMLTKSHLYTKLQEHPSFCYVTLPLDRFRADLAAQKLSINVLPSDISNSKIVFHHHL